MQTSKSTRKIIIIVGIVILVVSLLADTIGLGKPPFGLKQIIGTAAGVIIAGVGWFLNLKASRPSDQTD